MKKLLKLRFLAMIMGLTLLGCPGSLENEDNSDSKNVVDSDKTTDEINDETTNETTDQTTDETNDETTDQTTDETSDETTDETMETYLSALAPFDREDGIPPHNDGGHPWLEVTIVDPSALTGDWKVEFGYDGQIHTLLTAADILQPPAAGDVIRIHPAEWTPDEDGQAEDGKWDYTAASFLDSRYGSVWIKNAGDHLIDFVLYASGDDSEVPETWFSGKTLEVLPENSPLWPGITKEEAADSALFLGSTQENYAVVTEEDADSRDGWRLAQAPGLRIDDFGFEASVSLIDGETGIITFSARITLLGDAILDSVQVDVGSLGESVNLQLDTDGTHRGETDKLVFTEGKYPVKLTAIAGKAVKTAEKVVEVDALKLYFSDYGEGGSYNKYLEIYNGSSGTVTLSSNGQHFYYLLRLSNPDGEITLEDDGYVIKFSEDLTIAPGEVYGMHNSRAGSEIKERGDQGTGNISHDGDDVYALIREKNGQGGYQSAEDTIIDIIGDPSGAGEVFAMDQGLKRKGTVFAGSAAFNLEEWEVYPQSDVDSGVNYGVHSLEGSF